MLNRRQKPLFGISKRVWRGLRWALSVLFLIVHLYLYWLKLAESPVPPDVLEALGLIAHDRNGAPFSFGDTVNAVGAMSWIAVRQLVAMWAANPLLLAVLLWTLYEIAGMIAGASRYIRRLRRQRAARRKVVRDLQRFDKQAAPRELKPVDASAKQYDDFCI